MFISDFAIKRPIITVVCMLALVVFGIFALVQLKTDEFPDVSPPIVSVAIPYPGASPENFTLALGLNLFQGLFVSRIDYIMAISTLMVLPMILMFVLAQRYIVQGFISSGLKG